MLLNLNYKCSFIKHHIATACMGLDKIIKTIICYGVGVADSVAVGVGEDAGLEVGLGVGV